jgi:hypothetical protein
VGSVADILEVHAVSIFRVNSEKEVNMFLWNNCNNAHTYTVQPPTTKIIPYTQGGHVIA